MTDRLQFSATQNSHFDFNRWSHITWYEEDNL